MAKSPLQHAHHVVPTITYVKTFVMLTILMLATIFASYWQDVPGGVVGSNVIALSIAVAKAFLVIWVFMGIRWAHNLARLWAVAGFVVLPLMFIMYQDYFMRYHEDVPGWSKTSQEGSGLPRMMDGKRQDQVTPDAAGFRPRG